MADLLFTLIYYGVGVLCVFWVFTVMIDMAKRREQNHWVWSALSCIGTRGTSVILLWLFYPVEGRA